MGEELKKDASQSTESQIPSDDELDRAADLVDEKPAGDKPDGEKKEDEKKPDEGGGEEKPEKKEEDEGKQDEHDGDEGKPDSDEKKEDEDEDGEPKNNADRSRLGRRVKGLESKLDEVLNLLVTQASRPPAQEPPKEKEDEEELDPDLPLTLRDLETYNAKKVAVARQREEAYSKDYVMSVYKLSQSEEDKELLAEVLHEMDDNPECNQRVYGHSKIDAEANYLKAYKIVATKRMRGEPKKKSPLEKNEGKKGPADSGANAQSRSTARGVPPVELDEDAKHFLNYLKDKGATLSEADVKDALDSDIVSNGKKSYFKSNTIKR